MKKITEQVESIDHGREVKIIVRSPEDTKCDNEDSLEVILFIIPQKS